MSFRKIDIDAFDEDALQESELYEPDPRSPSQVLSDTQKKVASVRSLSARGDTARALAIALDSPPYGPDVENAKNEASRAVFSILKSTKAMEISNVLQALDQEAQDTLMKYIYKGMSMPRDVNGSVLLAWHEKLTEIAGIGCIVRVMTDRRIV